MYCIVVYCRVCTVLYCKKSLIAQSNKWIIYIHTIHLVISKLNRVWLVVDLPPLKNMSSSVWVILPNWMEKNPPNHQPVCVYIYIYTVPFTMASFILMNSGGDSPDSTNRRRLSMLTQWYQKAKCKVFLTNDQPNKPNNQPISINEAIVNQSSRINQPITKKFPVNHPQSARFWGPWFCEKTKRGWYIAWHP